MKASSAAARSYARALFSLAKERKQTDVISRDLATLVALVEGSRALRDFISRPWIGTAKRRAAAADVATAAGVSTLARDFLALVVAHRRGEHLGAIAEAYRDLDDEDRGLVRARVRTAVKLTDGEREALAARLGHEFGGKQVMLEEAVDPSLLGGFVAEVGSQVLDASLDAQIVRLRDRLAAG